MQHLIPTCFFPSTALFIDDSQDFLLNFVLQLDEGVAYRIFDNPKKALKYVRSRTSELEVLRKHCLSENSVLHQDNATNQSINLDLSALHNEIYNPNRFSEISVIVVDYAMPFMNGIEFCRQVDNPNIKKILLTGQADEKVAIQAFNEGLIHRYVKKSDLNAAEIITQSIYELQLQYFQTMSQTIIEMLSTSSPSCLLDKTFTQFFKNVCNENGIVEYYLADNAGSFLLLDDDANTSFLLVKSQKELNSLSQLAAKNGVNSDIVTALQEGKKMPTFWGAPTLQDGFDWASHLIHANCLQAEENYYYAYLAGNSLLDIRQHKILSYHRFLEELDAEELLLND